MVKGAPDYKGLVDRVMQPGIYLEAMKELGVTVKAQDMVPVKLMDGTFDPKEPERYARSFAVHTIPA
jgi:hypothetical protein